MSENKQQDFAAQCAQIFKFDEAAAIAANTQWMRYHLSQTLRRRGCIVAISGGIDSSVCASLAVRALGPKKVFGLLLPERDSSSSSSDRGAQLAAHLGIETIKQDIAPALEAIGCYQWRDEAIQSVFPEYGVDWKNKITIGGGSEGQFNFFKLVVQTPAGELFEKRLNIKAYLQIVAATNYKQRLRKSIEYFHADRLNYAVVGTPNRLEYDQGFFVKNGDGSADIKPIAHFYKNQVYQLARFMELPVEICNATPTTDTYSLDQGQDEFYYALPYQQMDIALLFKNQNKAAGELAKVLGIETHQAEHIYQDIDNKRRTTGVLHWPGLLMEQITGVVSAPSVSSGKSS